MVPDEQVTVVRRVLESVLPLRPWPFSESGQRVRIEYGAVAGVEALRMSIAIQVELDQIFPRPQYHPSV
jgi:hypothetical protein